MPTLERVFETVSDGFFLLDSELRVRCFNPAAERFLGRRAEEVLGKHLFDEVFPEAKGSEFERQYRSALADGKARQFETRFEVPPYVGWYDVRVLPNEQGLAVFFLVNTESSRRHREIAANEERLRTLCETVIEGLWLIDDEAKTSYVNPTMAEMLGYGVDEMMGRPLVEFVAPEARDAVAKNLRRRREGIREVHDFTFPHRDGHDVPVRIATSPLFDEENVYRGAVAAISDMGELRRHEARTRRRHETDRITSELAEAMLRPSETSASLSLRVLEVALEASRSRDGFVGSIDEETGELVSQTLGDLRDRGFCKVEGDGDGHVRFAPDERGRFPALWGKALNEGEGFHTNAPSTHPASTGLPEGHPAIDACLAIPILSGEQRLGLILLANPSTPYDDEDLSQVGRLARLYGLVIQRERREKREQAFREKMQQTQKLESLGVLAGGIAHDFNNLLMGVLGNADLALDELPRQSPTRACLEDIATSARRAADLCRQLLAYSGKGRFIIEALNMNELVAEMVGLLEISVSKTAVLKLELAETLPAIEADATQIRQILMNLVTNASEAIGSRSGIISVRTGALDCDEDYLFQNYLKEDLARGTYVHFEVSDTGHGMDAETLERIFDPFYSTKFTGRGLGLSAVLGIVRGHGGALRVYSEPGKGTTFKVLFPASGKEPMADPVRDEGETLLGDKRTVLLVDDEETVRAVAKRMLERIGFRVLLARDGAEGVEAFQKSHDELACVLLDLTMPRMGGEEAFRRMRGIDATVPVILSSGYNEQDVVHRFAGKGLTAFIQKPYRKERLVEVLSQLHRSKQDEENSSPRS